MRQGLLLLALLFISGSLRAQAPGWDQLGDKLSFITTDSSLMMQFYGRMQVQYHNRFQPVELEEYSDRIFIRRGRFGVTGFIGSPKVEYELEYSFAKSAILDAVVSWNFAPNWSIEAGQQVIPSNFEQIRSSSRLELVERSLIHGAFSSRRDIGLQLNHRYRREDFRVETQLGFFKGDGLRSGAFTPGHLYVGRIAVLPFGEVYEEACSQVALQAPDPRLEIAATYSLHQNATRAQGNRGELLPAERNLQKFFTNILFRYKGFSALGEFAMAHMLEGSPAVYGGGGGGIPGVFLDAYYTGIGMNAQAGLFLSPDWEVAARYSMVEPQEETRLPHQQEYVLGLNRYFKGHCLKVQADVGYLQAVGEEDALQGRMQVQVSF